ncbi:MAG TPA: nuclear transport factor 2 family protein [Gemmatimonadales bacterium]|jgi:hypothetical protein
MRYVLLGALLTVALVACGAGGAPVTDRVTEAALRARFDAWVSAWNAHHPDSLAPFYVQADYLSVTWPTGEVKRGWTQESEYQRSFLPTVVAMNLAPQSPRIVLVRSNLALVTFPFTLDLTAGGARQIGPGQGMTLWQKEGGAWRIYAAQLSYTGGVKVRV